MAKEAAAHDLHVTLPTSHLRATTAFRMSGESRSSSRLFSLRGGFLDATGARLAVLFVAVMASCLVVDNPLQTTSWLGIHGVTALALSLAEGALVAVLFVFCTRFWIVRLASGRALARELSAKAAEMSTRHIWFVAGAAGLTEELFFRGALAPTCGALVSAVAFGALHFRSGWAWSLLAAAFGAALALVFLSSGSLAGPLLAHVAVDAIALFAARDASVHAQSEKNLAHRLGGLLGDAAARSTH